MVIACLVFVYMSSGGFEGLIRHDVLYILNRLQERWVGAT
jgi:hypothetical protein